MTDVVLENSIVKQVNQELAYPELDRSIENLWSVLFTTGYLITEELQGRWKTGTCDSEPGDPGFVCK